MDTHELLKNMESIESIYRFIEIHNINEILEIVSKVLKITPERLSNYPMGGYSRIVNEDGSFSKGNGCYIFILHDLKKHLNDYLYLYSRLCDDISREIFMNQLRYRILPSENFINASHDLSLKYSQYFDEEIYKFGEDEVFIDCGGYTGDSAIEFIKRCNNYKKIYIYEPLIENIEKCYKNLKSYKNIVIRQAGVGNKSKQMTFSGGGSSGSFAVIKNIDANNENTLDIISLDEDINEKITFIKMDVECFEPDAIKGAAEHIKNESPKLAVCLYHMVSDLWAIPKLINEINPNYNYFLRHYHSNKNWEYVLYAIPNNFLNERVKNIQKKSVYHISTYTQDIFNFLFETDMYMDKIDYLPLETAVELYDMLEVAAQTATMNIQIVDPELRVKICDRKDRVLERVVDLFHPISAPMHSVYTPAIQNYRRWTNTELMKDKGMVGYTLAKEVSARPVMFFGTEPSDYSYLTELPLMDIIYHDAENGNLEPYYEYLIKNHLKMDVLILHGMYEQTIRYLDVYRKLRPDGKVYCGLDMNSYWMDKIKWKSVEVKRFAEQCDVVATSCRFLRDELNRNPDVQFACRWFPNGFYNPSGKNIIINPEQKNNVILTVGRIGTAQKNNEELLIAFAKVSEVLSGWTLKFVGSIEPAFQSFINQYFTARPDLKDKIIFTGAITDKIKLYNEYAEAKIFILTSRFEGGTPNVYAEALFHGCMFITSDIDAADDITNYGKLGVKYKRGDIEALSSTLVNVCSRADIHTLKNHIPKALDYAAKYYDWNRNAKKLAYMLYKNPRG